MKHSTRSGNMPDSKWMLDDKSLGTQSCYSSSMRLLVDKEHRRPCQTINVLQALLSSAGNPGCGS
jgi:hypothetical protein